MPGLVHKVRVRGNREDLDTQPLELVVVVGHVAELGGADEGEIGRVEEDHSPLSPKIGLGDLDEFAIPEGGGGERQDLGVDDSHAGTSRCRMLTVGQANAGRPRDIPRLCRIVVAGQADQFQLRAAVPIHQPSRLRRVPLYVVAPHHRPVPADVGSRLTRLPRMDPARVSRPSEDVNDAANRLGALYRRIDEVVEKALGDPVRTQRRPFRR